MISRCLHLSSLLVSESVYLQDNVLSNFKPRKKRLHPEYAIIEQDPAIQRYFNNIKSKAKNNGHLSEATRRKTLHSAVRFLKYLNRKITKKAMHNLIQQKRNLPPTNDKLETALEFFSNLQPLKAHRANATYIKGIFKANRCKLDVFIDNHFNTETEPISEGILKAIYKAQTPEKQLLMQLQAYSGQRVECLATLTTETQKLQIENYTLLRILSHQNKSRIDHYTIIPTKLYKQLTKQAEQAKRKTFFPNYRRLWQEITKYAKEEHNIKFTSHYLRKRYTSLAQETPIPVNHYDYLQGSKPKSGHDANTYLLKDYEKFVLEYHTYLMPLLHLNTSYQQHDNDNRHNATNKTKNTYDDNSDILQSILKTLQTIQKEMNDLKNTISYTYDHAEQTAHNYHTKNKHA